MLVTAAFPACDNGLLTIRGHYFEETDFPIGVSLELTELTVLDSDETFILAELPATFCDRPGSYLLTVTRKPRVAPRGKTAKSKSKKGSRRRATAKLTPLDVGMFDVSIGDDGGIGATGPTGPQGPTGARRTIWGHRRQ